SCYFLQAEDGIRDRNVTGVQTCALPISDDVVIEYNNRHINLERAVINEVILALPMKSLCSSDCKGICQKCGKNLNEGKCDCEIDDIDPRLAKLKELL